MLLNACLVHSRVPLSFAELPLARESLIFGEVYVTIVKQFFVSMCQFSMLGSVLLNNRDLRRSSPKTCNFLSCKESQ